MNGLIHATRSRKNAAINRYLGMILLLLALVVVSSALGFIYRTNTLLDETLVQQGRAITSDLRIIRKWVRSQGGIYLRHGDKTNDGEFLIKDGEGGQLIRHNAAQVTQMLSRISNESGVVRFAAVSLDPLTPTGEADAFEREAIQRMRQGEKEVFQFDSGNDDLMFRYMTPLKTTKNCLKCHAHRGFEPGRVDSGISLEIPAKAIHNEKHLNRIMLITTAIAVIVLVSLTIWLLARRFLRQLSDADARLERMAAEDVLTGLYNRRMGMELLDAEIARSKRKARHLSIALFDIDHFKRINDTMGHQTGDEGLRGLAQLILSQLRQYDMAFRYGGEEFILILPDTQLSDALLVSERLRATVESEIFPSSHPDPLRFTISIGLTELSEGLETDELLSRADKALYEAKEKGRNQVRIYSEV